MFWNNFDFCPNTNMSRISDYQLLKDVHEVVGRIEIKLDRVEERVSTLERWRAEIVGKMAILAAVVSVAFTAGWDYIRRKINL